MRVTHQNQQKVVAMELLEQLQLQTPPGLHDAMLEALRDLQDNMKKKDQGTGWLRKESLVALKKDI